MYYLQDKDKTIIEAVSESDSFEESGALRALIAKTGLGNSTENPVRSCFFVFNMELQLEISAKDLVSLVGWFNCSTRVYKSTPGRFVLMANLVGNLRSLLNCANLYQIAELKEETKV
jgi:hypothetical protein